MRIGTSLSNSSSSGNAASAILDGPRLMEALITLPSERTRVHCQQVCCTVVTMFNFDSSDLGSVASESTTATSSTKDEEVAPPVHTSSTKDHEEATLRRQCNNAMVSFTEHATSRKPAKSCLSSLIGKQSVARSGLLHQDTPCWNHRLGVSTTWQVGWIRSRDRCSRIALCAAKRLAQASGPL